MLASHFTVRAPLLFPLVAQLAPLVFLVSLQKSSSKPDGDTNQQQDKEHEEIAATISKAMSPQAANDVLSKWKQQNSAGKPSHIIKQQNTPEHNNLVETLRKEGMDRQAANEQLSEWKQAGVKDGDPDELLKLFQKESKESISYSQLRVRMPGMMQCTLPARP